MNVARHLAPAATRISSTLLCERAFATVNQQDHPDGYRYKGRNREPVRVHPTDGLEDHSYEQDHQPDNAERAHGLCRLTKLRRHRLLLRDARFTQAVEAMLNVFLGEVKLLHLLPRNPQVETRV